MQLMCLHKEPCISRIFMISDLPVVERNRFAGSGQAGTGPGATDLSCHHLVGIHLHGGLYHGGFRTCFILLTVFHPHKYKSLPSLLFYLKDFFFYGFYLFI